MSEIKRTGKWNPGGGRWLELLPAAFVASYTRASRSATPTVTLKTGFAWSRVYCTPDTLKYRVSADSSGDNGPIYTVDIVGFSADDNQTKNNDLDSLFLYKRFLVRFCDNSGLIRIAGTPIESLQLSYELSTDAEVAGSRGYSLSLTGTLSTRPAYA